MHVTRRRESTRDTLGEGPDDGHKNAVHTPRPKVVHENQLALLGARKVAEVRHTVEGGIGRGVLAHLSCAPSWQLMERQQSLPPDVLSSVPSAPILPPPAPAPPALPSPPAPPAPPTPPAPTAALTCVNMRAVCLLLVGRGGLPSPSLSSVHERGRRRRGIWRRRSIWMCEV